jgi:site-specific recombinase XerD
MFEISLYKRFTFLKTKDFWELIEGAESSYSANSLDYSVIKRDKVIFQLLYSYGLRTSEAMGLSINDFNFNENEKAYDSFGSIYVSGKTNRLVYPVFPEVTEEISRYLNMYKLFYKTSVNNIFKTTKGTDLTIHYLKNRLKYYNSKLPSTKRIDSLYYFRQCYITDLLRIKEISQSLINNQIGNNILNNQVYLHLHPNINEME